LPHAYLELIRPANVTTALADVLAGFAVAGLANLPALPWLLGASACLYAGGVVLNDVFDRRVDATERPERPLPSGRVTVAGAAWLGGALLVVGSIAAGQATGAAGVIGVVLAAFVLLYDSWGKRQRWFGPLNMGLCRGLNLLLGMAAVPAALAAHWPVALIPITYITGVTLLSRGEVSGGRKQSAAVALLLVGLAGGAVLVLSLRSTSGRLAGLVWTTVLAWRVFPAFWGAFRQPDPGPIRHAVRTGVISLVLLDAALAAAYAGAGYSLLLLAVALAAGWLARSWAVT
jgi:4-hydroxybenzoate polyprenyltransferase